MVESILRRPVFHGSFSAPTLVESRVEYVAPQVHFEHVPIASLFPMFQKSIFSVTSSDLYLISGSFLEVFVDFNTANVNVDLKMRVYSG